MATNNTINPNFKNKGKDIKYLNKDFASFRQNLIEYAKTYFPRTYSDFNETSPGMMFIEMASYLGDVLSYYVDDTFKESLMPYAEDRRSVLALSQFLGYKPKVSSPSVTTLSLYQLVPAIGQGASNRPDSTFYLRIQEGMTVESTYTGTEFRVIEEVDFAEDFNREITVYERDINSGEASFYLIKKQVQAVASTLNEINVSFGDYQPFQQIELGEIGRASCRERV
jgi:hypothetical protein